MHVALVCPELTGHLNPMTTLGQAVRDRGHRVSLVGVPAAISKAEAAGLCFIEIGQREFAAGRFRLAQERLGELRGLAAMRFTGKMLATAAAVMLRDAPDAFRRSGVEAVLVDQVSPAGAAVAEALQLPLGIVCNALALHFEPGVPPAITSWSPGQSQMARTRNHIGNVLLRSAAKPVFDHVNAFRREHGMSLVTTVETQQAGLVQLAQQPAFFDFPRERLPDHFHYTGPWHSAGRDANVSFPWDRLDGRPIVYASFGTLQNRLRSLFEATIAACRNLDVQLVLSLGSAGMKWELPVPANAIVVQYAPQLALLQRAAVLVTHAGLNTALEGLACGLPMVAVPVTNDQPGVARRLAWLGVAQIVPSRRTSPRRLRAAIEKALINPSYREAALRCKLLLRESPGAEGASALAIHALAGGARLTRMDSKRIWGDRLGSESPT